MDGIDGLRNLNQGLVSPVIRRTVSIENPRCERQGAENRTKRGPEERTTGPGEENLGEAEQVLEKQKPGKEEYSQGNLQGKSWQYGTRKLLKHPVGCRRNEWAQGRKPQNPESAASDCGTTPGGQEHPADPGQKRESQFQSPQSQAGSRQQPLQQEGGREIGSGFRGRTDKARERQRHPERECRCEECARQVPADVRVSRVTETAQSCKHRFGEEGGCHHQGGERKGNKDGPESLRPAGQRSEPAPPSPQRGQAE